MTQNEEARINISILVLTLLVVPQGQTNYYLYHNRNWNSESVFQRFYHKQVDKAADGRAEE